MPQQSAHRADRANPFVIFQPSAGGTFILPLTSMPERRHKKPYADLLGKPGSLLFATPQSTGTPPRWTSSTTTTNAPLGYLVFPTGDTSSTAFPSGLDASSKAHYPWEGLGRSSEASLFSSSSIPSRASSPPTPEPHNPNDPEPNDPESEPEPDPLTTLHTQRLAREAAEALKGEEYWVSCGGVLRDTYGRRDLPRTLLVREELRLRAVETKLREAWEAYERAWRGISARARGVFVRPTNASDGDGSGNEDEERLGFTDIPWPIDHPPHLTSLLVLTPPRIEAFLLDPLTIRGCTTSKRERVRSSLLRWHPDKLAGVMALVEEEEKETVVQGVSVVFRCLQRLNSTVL